MNAYQNGGSKGGRGVPAIGASVVDGLIIAVLNYAMVNMLSAFRKIDAGMQVWGMDFINLVGLELALIIFMIDVASVVAAYRIMGWPGVFLYLFGWVFVASQIPVIGIGAVPITVGLIMLVLYEYILLK